MATLTSTQNNSNIGNMNPEPYLDQTPEIAYALNRIRADYGDDVSVDKKLKTLTKFGESETVGTSLTEIATLPPGVSSVALTAENDNAITSVVSSSTSDTGTIYYEGMYWNSGDLYFTVGSATLTGRTAVVLDTPLGRVTRAYSTSAESMVGDVSFYEGGSITNGVPDTGAEVHMILQAGQAQTEKCSASVSSQDYWILSDFTAVILDKTSSSAQMRVEFKPATSTIWRPLSQYVGCSNTSGTTQVYFVQHKIVPSNHDVRMVAVGSGSNIHVAGGIHGWLAN